MENIKFNNLIFGNNMFNKQHQLAKYKLPKVRTYLSEANFAQRLSKKGYFDNGTWCQFNSHGKDIQGPWKMHIYADGQKDYQDVANAILPYLQDRNIKHKCLGSMHSIYEQMQTKQAGKTITIYPSSNEEMERIAKDIDYIIRNNNLTRRNTHIEGDRMMGDNGRMFYRYEYRSGKYDDIYLNMNQYYVDEKIKQQIGPQTQWYANKGVDKLYEFGLYEANRGQNQHLASDMVTSDDIWHNFNPEDINSHRRVKVKPTQSKIYANVPIMLNLDPNHEYGKHMCDSKTSEWFVYDKTLQRVVRDIEMEEKVKGLYLG